MAVYKATIQQRTGWSCREDPRQHLRSAVEAVLNSWNGARVLAYRNRERIGHDLGTAVNAMVFGNLYDINQGRLNN